MDDNIQHPMEGQTNNNGLFGNNYRVATPNCYKNHHAKFEIDKTILSCLNQRKELNRYR